MLQANRFTRQITGKIVFIILPFTLIFILSQCGNQREKEEELRQWCAQKTDTLWNILSDTRKNFTYEMDEIAERKMVIDSNLILIHKAYPAGLKGEAASYIPQYKSILAVYNPVASEYKSMILETEDLFFQVKTLDADVERGSYDKDVSAFKSTYAELVSRLSANYKRSVDVSEKLKTVEPMYIRLSPKIDDIISNLP
ncbi:MAG: hypothetical protein KG003_10995 [Bacteroidetes bacterium]|nr:hypothetical protein [Bacteroidota bacterium]